MRAGYQIRPAAAGDLAVLAAIEHAGAGLLADAGISGEFLHGNVAAEIMADAQADGRVWVAATESGCVGFALVIILEDGLPHLEEIDVHPAHGRRGIGRSLVETVIGWARARGAASLSLSTFRDIRWNAPFYASLGFREVAADQGTPALRRIADEERQKGLPMETRVVMRLALVAGRR